MGDLDELIDRYFAAWNERDAHARQERVAALWTEDGHYVDPLASVEGPSAIASVIAAAQDQFPGYVFRLLGTVDSHHDVARFQWELVPAGGGEALAAGSDVAVIAADGRLRGVYGFLDKVPTA
jgi:hypothetical protein